MSNVNHSGNTVAEAQASKESENTIPKLTFDYDRILEETAPKVKRLRSADPYHTRNFKISSNSPIVKPLLPYFARKNQK